MSLVDDSRLVQLARPPAGEIFLVLNRTSALKPLLVLFAILPGLYALQYRTFTDADALWGLRTLKVFTAGSIEAIADPEVDGPEAELRFEPPLGSWLDALAMRLFGPSFFGATVVSSYLSLVALVGLTYILFRALAGGRLAILVAALVGCHGPVFALAQTAAPAALAVMLAVMTFWSYLRHLQDSTSAVSLRLLVAGIALGLCVLAGGPLALLVALVLLIHVLGLRGESVRKRRGGETKPVRTWVGWPALRSLAVMVFTAFAVGGWWPLMMFSRYGRPFLIDWLAGFTSTDAGTGVELQEVPGFFALAISEFAVAVGPFLGLSALGLYCAIRKIMTTEDENRRRSLVFLLAWLGCGILVWMTVLLRSSGFTPTATEWQAFFVIPAVALAALAIDEAARRQLHVLAVVFAACLMLAFLTAVWSRVEWQGLGIVSQTASLSLSLAAVVIAAFWMSGAVRSRDARERVVLVSLLLAQILGGAVAGFRLVNRTTADDTALASFRTRLADLETMSAVTVINERTLPPQLRFTLRAGWPRAEWIAADNWDAALAHALTGSVAAPRRSLIFDWSERDVRPASLQIPGVTLEPVPTTEFFGGRELRVYRLFRSA